MVKVHGYTTDIEAIIFFRRIPLVLVRYNDWQGWPDTCECTACAKTADKSQVEKVWRRKDDGSPPPAHMN